ncbi:unnamed protein product [Boreogadus saida]
MEQTPIRPAATPLTYSLRQSRSVGHQIRDQGGQSIVSETLTRAKKMWKMECLSWKHYQCFQAQANCPLHYLAECQAVDTLLLNLEKIVQHLTMGQDCITLHPH